MAIHQCIPVTWYDSIHPIRLPLNSALDTVVICPLTSTIHPNWRTRLQIELNGKKYEIAVDQIRVVSKDRLTGKKIGELGAKSEAALRDLLSEAYAQ
jgi:mRNA interferase MazF